MHSVRRSFGVLALLACINAPAMARGDDHNHHKSAEGTETPTAKPAAEQVIGDPYPFGTCPVSGEKLGSMGEPVVRVYDGREVRFCCDGCPAKFEKDKAGSFAALDKKVIADQEKLYPLSTSVVSGKKLPDHPVDVVVGNRLIRLADESEKVELSKDPKKHLAALDKAVIEAQGKQYALAKCPVSGEEFGGEMGKPVDYVVAGRLIRLCCAPCKKDVQKDPAKFIAIVDEARHP